MREKDWIQYILDQPVTGEPGMKFYYNSGVSHLLSVSRKKTGVKTVEFARKHLFEHLGISDIYWMEDPMGINIGNAFLQLTPRDMEKFDYIYLSCLTFIPPCIGLSSISISSVTINVYVISNSQCGTTGLLQPSVVWISQKCMISLIFNIKSV
jgi:hypothetical protein